MITPINMVMQGPSVNRRMPHTMAGRLWGTAGRSRGTKGGTRHFGRKTVRTQDTSNSRECGHVGTDSSDLSALWTEMLPHGPKCLTPRTELSCHIFGLSWLFQTTVTERHLHNYLSETPFAYWPVRIGYFQNPDIIYTTLCKMQQIHYIHNVVQMILISYIHNVGRWRHSTHEKCYC